MLELFHINDFHDAARIGLILGLAFVGYLILDAKVLKRMGMSSYECSRCQFSFSAPRHHVRVKCTYCGKEFIWRKDGTKIEL